MRPRAAFALVLYALGAAASAAPPGPAPPPPAISSDQFESDLSTGESVFKGSCRYRERGVLITADEIHFNAHTNIVVALGHATLTRGEERLVADRIEYDRAHASFHAENIHVGRYPFYIEGRSADGTAGEITIHHAAITYTDPGAWKPSIKAETIVYSPGHYLRLVKSLVGLHGEEFVPLGAIRESLTSVMAAPYLSLTVGYRSFLGATADLGLRLPVLPGVKFGGDLGLFTARGVMLGPSADYFDPNNEGDLLGTLRSGWIDDYGPKYVDILNNPIPRRREYIAWQHQQQLGDHLTLDGEINWWSDSDVFRDFYTKQFYQDQNPDSYLEANYTGQNTFGSVFTRFQPNAWEAVQQRLPEFSYNLLPLSLGGGFFQRLEASAVYLRELPPVSGPTVREISLAGVDEFLPVGGSSGPNLASDRVDAFYEISRPWNPNDWFNLTPVAGARITDYSGTQGAEEPGGYLRALGEVGFDAQLRSSGTFDYQNPLWDINGLRHLFTPIVSYRFIPDADKGQEYIPQIDRQTFSTYLQPLDLGDIRSLDQLESQNTLRLGLDNTLQTRQDGYGSRNLLTLNFADDFHLQRFGTQQDFSDFHTDLTVTPAKWIEYDVAEVINPESWQLREFSSGLILRDGEAWTFRVGNDFVRHENDNYILDTELRLNEDFQVTYLAEYDARIHVINRMAIGLVGNLANTWKIEPLLILNGGPNREGHVAFEVQVDILRF